MRGHVRGTVVNGGIVIRLVTGHGFRRALLVDQGAVLGRRGGSIGRGGLDCRSTLDRAGVETGIDRGNQASRPETSRASNSEERHGEV